MRGGGRDRPFYLTWEGQALSSELPLLKMTWGKAEEHSNIFTVTQREFPKAGSSLGHIPLSEALLLFSPSH